MAKCKTKSIGILTAGGDCPGLNAAIRSIGKAALGTYDIQVVGISEGFHGLITDQTKILRDVDFSGILTRGGTILGSSREKPFAKKDADPLAEHKVEMVLENYRKLHLDCLVCIGGNGTQTAAYKLSQLGINVLGLPKTIDNDLAETDFTFGFMSAVNVTTEAIDRLHTTAHSHSRIMVLETMGHKAGWLALYSGVAGGGDVILLPEIPYDPQIIRDHLVDRARKGKEFSIVVAAEGALSKTEARRKKSRKAQGKKKQEKTDDGPSAGYRIAAEIEKGVGLETRVTVLGYLPRGGTPSPFDRQLATGLGAEAVGLLVEGDYNRMVCMKKGKITSVPLEKVAGKTKKVPANHALIAAGRLVGTCFGD